MRDPLSPDAAVKLTLLGTTGEHQTGTRAEMGLKLLLWFLRVNCFGDAAPMPSFGFSMWQTHHPLPAPRNQPPQLALTTLKPTLKPTL